jgi:hypothetical protein
MLFLGAPFSLRVEGRRQFITNRTARTQDNKNVGRKPVTHWHRREREKKRERERDLKSPRRQSSIMTGGASFGPCSTR